MTGHPDDCAFARQEPPGAAQWIQSRRVWRCFWPCGCIATTRRGRPEDPPPGVYVAPTDQSPHGDGDGDDYIHAIREWLHEPVVRH